jgi:hypothetical protein
MGKKSLVSFDAFGCVEIVDPELLEAVSAGGDIALIRTHQLTVNAICGSAGDRIPLTLNGICTA